MADLSRYYKPLPNSPVITETLALQLGAIDIPGDVANTTAFLRKDGTYAIPAGSASSGGGALFSTKVTITPAEIVAMVDSPVLLVPAPGDGLTVIPVMQTFQAVLGSQNMTEVSDLAVYYESRSAGISLSVNANEYPNPDIISSSIANSIDTNRLQVINQSGFINGPPNDTFTADVENKPVVLTTSTDTPWACDTGTGPIIVLRINDGGADFAEGDTGTIDSGDGNATYEVLSESGGAITAILLTGAGTNYITETDINLVPGGSQPGIGTGGTVNIFVAGDADCELIVTTHYVVVPWQTPEPDEESQPSNAQYAVTGGVVELYRRKASAAGYDLPQGLYSFRDLAVSYDDYHYLQNTDNPDIITNNAGVLEVNYPCVIQVTANVNGAALVQPFAAQLALSHTSLPDEVYGTVVSVSDTAGLPAEQGTPLSVTTGPMPTSPPEGWDGVLLIENTDTGDLMNVSQVYLSIAVLEVLGVALTTAVAAAGANYAVGDTLVANYDFYIRPLIRVTGVNMSGGVTTFELLDPGLGCSLGIGFPTTPISPQPGVGSGFTFTISAASGLPV